MSIIVSKKGTINNMWFSSSLVVSPFSRMRRAMCSTHVVPGGKIISFHEVAALCALMHAAPRATS